MRSSSILTRIAEDKRLQQSIVAQLDERTVSQVRLWVQGVLHRRLFLRDDYHTALVETITSLAARGGVVFLGRGANLMTNVWLGFPFMMVVCLGALHSVDRRWRPALWAVMVLGAWGLFWECRCPTLRTAAGRNR